ncbi:YncE family protein [Hansschlegelia sp. KR7-227]|uniref:YncE family protein n=1 Tax=Hansschlegelia sp. KR7-227 TaxID=3400914 RepID=UPI003C0B619D
MTLRALAEASRAVAAGVVGALLMLAGAAAAEEPVLAVVCQTDGAVRLLPLGEDAPERVEVGELPAGVAVGPDGRTVYVTSPDRGRVTVLDAVTKRVTASFPVKGQPFGAAATDEFLLVTDWSRSVVHRLDALTGATMGEIATGKSPAAIVMDRAGRRAYVAAREDDVVSVIDVAANAEIGRIPVGRAPFALALSPDERRLYVANVQSGDLSVIDVTDGPEGGREVKRVPVGRMPYGVAVAPDGARLAVTLQHDNALAIVDAATLEVTARVKVGSYPEGVALTPDGKRAAVANWFDDTVSLVDLDAGRVTATLKAEGGPRTLLALAP